MKHSAFLILTASALICANAFSDETSAAPAPTLTTPPVTLAPATDAPAPAAATTPATTPAAATPAPDATVPDINTRPLFIPTFRSDLQVADYLDEHAASDLLERREKLIQRMHENRVYFIENDDKARTLKQQIVSLQKELAVLIENKKVMRDLNRELADLDREIDKLQKKEIK